MYHSASPDKNHVPHFKNFLLFNFKLLRFPIHLRYRDFLPIHFTIASLSGLKAIATIPKRIAIASLSGSSLRFDFRLHTSNLLRSSVFQLLPSPVSNQKLPTTQLPATSVPDTPSLSGFPLRSNFGLRSSVSFLPPPFYPYRHQLRKTPNRKRNLQAAPLHRRRKKHFGCLVDGKAWIPKGSFYNSGASAVSTTYDSRRNYLSIVARKYGEKDEDYTGFSIVLYNVNEIGEYDLFDNSLRVEHVLFRR
jgi:hypothetical protein